MWAPQWGVQRPIRTCPACAQRWVDYTRGQSGYPQQGYPQGGYVQPGVYVDDYPRHGYGAGTVAAAGAAGFVGGMIANEMFDHHGYVEHVDVVETVEVVEDVEIVEDYGDYGSDW
jgi:tellurium resistance protein TerD